MKYANVFEKMISFLMLLKDNYYAIALLGFIFFFSILLLLKKISKRSFFVISFVGYFVFFGYVFYQNYEFLSRLFDRGLNYFFTNFYFPSIFFYLFLLIFLDVVTFVSFFGFRKKSIYSVIHGSFFLMFHFVFVFILDLIAKHQIDVFSKASLFSNTTLVEMLELSIQIFVGWILLIMIAYFTNMISQMILRRDKKKEIAVESIQPINNTQMVEVAVSEEKLKEEDALKKPVTQFIPDWIRQQTKPTYQFLPNLEQLNVSKEMESNSSLGGFDLSSFIPKKEMNSSRNYSNQQVMFHQVLHNELPIIEKQDMKVEKAVNFEKDSYTLNDYRIFHKMLKDIREHNQSNTIYIDKNLEYRLITKYSAKTYQMFQRMLQNYSN